MKHAEALVLGCIAGDFCVYPSGDDSSPISLPGRGQSGTHRVGRDLAIRWSVGRAVDFEVQHCTTPMHQHSLGCPLTTITLVTLETQRQVHMLDMAPLPQVGPHHTPPIPTGDSQTASPSLPRTHPDPELIGGSINTGRPMVFC